MKKQEYDNFLKLSTTDRIVFMNKGTIAENLKLLIEISDAEKGKFYDKPTTI